MRDFIESRIAALGFKSVYAFCQKSGFGRQTLYRIIDEQGEPHPLTLEGMARALQFVDWADLQDARRVNDVQRRLPGTVQPGVKYSSHGGGVEPSLSKKQMADLLQWAEAEGRTLDELLRERIK